MASSLSSVQFLVVEEVVEGEVRETPGHDVSITIQICQTVVKLL